MIIRNAIYNCRRLYSNQNGEYTYYLGGLLDVAWQFCFEVGSSTPQWVAEERWCFL